MGLELVEEFLEALLVLGQGVVPVDLNSPLFQDTSAGEIWLILNKA